MKKTLSTLAVFGLMLSATPAFAWCGAVNIPQCHPIRCNPAPVVNCHPVNFYMPCIPPAHVNCQPVHCRH